MNSILTLFILVSVLSALLLGLYLLLSPRIPDEVKFLSFECGLLPIPGQTISH